ncbi:g2684 [Coccomyxa elongata]
MPLVGRPCGLQQQRRPFSSMPKLHGPHRLTMASFGKPQTIALDCQKLSLLRLTPSYNQLSCKGGLSQAPCISGLPQRHRQGRSSRSAWVCNAGSCCSSGSVLSAHGSGKGHNPVERGVDWVFRVTGLQKVAHKLHDDERVTWAILALIVGATFAHIAAGLVARYASHLMQAKVACLVGVYLLAGVPGTMEVCEHLAAGEVNPHVLMMLSALGTIVLGKAFEGAWLLVLFNLSHAIEHNVTQRAQGSMATLDQGPQGAWRVPTNPDGSPASGEPQRIHSNDVRLGDLIYVRAGEQVPVDGITVRGAAHVSSQHITGEAQPILAEEGTELLAGSLSTDSWLILRATKVARESALARIAELTEFAKKHRPKIQGRLDRFGEWYSWFVILSTLVAIPVLAALGVPLVGAGAEPGALYRAMGWLTAAAPCALVMVPLAYTSAQFSLSRRDILVRRANVFDAVQTCGTVAFDKTGTLTTGVMAATSMQGLQHQAQHFHQSSSGLQSNSGAWAEEVAASGSAADRKALALAITLSRRVSHPVADALVALGDSLEKLRRAQHQASSDGLPHLQISGFRTGTGGSEAAFEEDGQYYFARFGSVAYASSALPPQRAADLAHLVEGLKAATTVSVLVAGPRDATTDNSNGTHLGSESLLIRVFTFEDQVRPSSRAAVDALRGGKWRSERPRPGDALRVIMLTGDNQDSAHRVAASLGITDVRAGLRPGEKKEAIDAAQNENSASPRGSGVIMVGDGMNDLPALAAATVGVGVAGSRPGAVANWVDVILLSDNGAEAVPLLLETAHRTRSIVRQNLALAIGSILALALPALAGWIPLWAAVALHEGTTVLVALNCTRLLSAPSRHWTSAASSEDIRAGTLAGTSTPTAGNGSAPADSASYILGLEPASLHV